MDKKSSQKRKSKKYGRQNDDYSTRLIINKEH